MTRENDFFVYYCFIENILCKTPINLINYRNRVGQTFSFTITGKSGKNVWGTKIYTDDSNLATAAVHAGIIKHNETKTVDVEILPGQLSYQGSIQNGIVSEPFSGWAGSYLFPNANDNSDMTTTNLGIYRNMVGKTYSFVITGNVLGSVWGTDIYTDDSNLATAAVHAGVIHDGETKTVMVRILPGQIVYHETNRNNVTSLPHGCWKGSYSFVTATNNSDMSPSNFTVEESKYVELFIPYE